MSGIILGALLAFGLLSIVEAFQGKSILEIFKMILHSHALHSYAYMFACWAGFSLIINILFKAFKRYYLRNEGK